MSKEKSEAARIQAQAARYSSTLREAKALGDPTRYRIFRYVEQAAHPVYVEELTELLGMNHNAIRQHLAVLKDANLVIERLESRSKPGRPRLQYLLSPGVPGSWGTEGPYQAVALLMAEMIKSKQSARDVGRAAGKNRFSRLSGPKRGALVALQDSLTADGFSPRRSRSKGGWEFTLDRCPYAEVASADPGTVCQLHLGMLEGMVATLDPQVDLALSLRDPRKAGCKVRVRGGSSASELMDG